MCANFGAAEQVPPVPLPLHRYLTVRLVAFGALFRDVFLDGFR
jgi:hypothetical protein